MLLRSKLKEYRNYIENLIIPAVVFGFITGTITSLIVTLYKLCAEHIIYFSQEAYSYIRENLYLLPILLAALFGLSLLLALIYKKMPNVKGGGIPTSVGILRGLITFKWLKSLVGVFTLSLTTFLVGVPLGNEGPSVQIGTSIGRGSVSLFAKKHKAWDRYSMTGGACAGFSVATGAPISGIVFAIEEAHQRISPTIMIVASSSVLFANITSSILSPLMGVSRGLFESLELPTLELSQLWIPLLVGTVVGLFSAIVLKCYKHLDKLFNDKMARVKPQYKIFAILALTAIIGTFSYSCISTGHGLIHKLYEGEIILPMLLLILVFRTMLTIGANTNGITGGMFLPTLALGATMASIFGKVSINMGLNPELYTVILTLGIVACLSGLVKTPLTAIIFGIEALSCYENIISIIIVSLVAYLITEMLGTKSINDIAMQRRIEQANRDKTAFVIDTHVTIQNGSFASGKQVRDIFWPANLFVLSVKKAEMKNEEVDEHGGKELRVGDVLHIQYSTYDKSATAMEVEAIVGKQST